MLGGVLAGAGYNMGSRPLVTREATNEKGFFEDEEIVDINETLLEPACRLTARTPWGRRRQRARLPERGLRWVAALPPDIAIPSSPDLDERIRKQTEKRPFCFKDPRLSYTVPVWHRIAPDALLICIFREPSRTADSIVREWSRHSGRRPIRYADALGTWRAMYRAILRRRLQAGDWLFVHYDDVLDGTAMPALERALDTRVDRDFPEARLNHAREVKRIGRADQQLYDELCRLARIGTAQR
jgi:hypothetical protein